ncbi:MAG: Crp/Fnr family transcriptional regulator [Bacteroidetes bacterium]|nr:Crp/Fnr family transcriptional regulator [Bacteroidota bacterium]
MKHSSSYNQRRQEAVDQLLQVLQHLYPLTPAIQDYFREKVFLSFYDRGALVVEQHQTCEHYCFIASGALRGFVKHADKEITTWMSVENELVTSIYSLHQRMLALENIQAVEPSWLLQLKVEKMEALYRLHPDFNISGRILLQQYYRDAELRAYLARIPDAEQKYRFFRKQYPYLDQRMPLKLIASYLGIRHETLSRIRKRVEVSGGR